MKCLIISLSIIQLIWLCHCHPASPSRSTDNKNVIDLLLQSVVNAISGNTTAGPPLSTGSANENVSDLTFDRRETGVHNGSNWDAISKFLWKPIVAPIDLTARPAPIAQLAPRTTSRSTTKKIVTEWMPTLPLINDEEIDSITLSNLFNEQEHAPSTRGRTKDSYGPAFQFTMTLPTMKISETLSTSLPSTTTAIPTTSTTTTTTARPRTTITSLAPTTREELFHNNRKYPHNSYNSFNPYNPYPNPNPDQYSNPKPNQNPYPNPYPIPNPTSRTTVRAVPKEFITISIPKLPVIKATVIAGNFDQVFNGSTSKWSLITVGNPMKSTLSQLDSSGQTSTPKTLYKDDMITPEPLFGISSSSLGPLGTDRTETVASEQQPSTKGKRYKRAVPKSSSDIKPIDVHLDNLEPSEELDESDEKGLERVASTTRTKRTMVKTENNQSITETKLKTKPTSTKMNFDEDENGQDEITNTIKPKQRASTPEMTRETLMETTPLIVEEDDDDEEDEILTTAKPKKAPKKVKKIVQLNKFKTTTPFYEDEEENGQDYENFVALNTRPKMIGPVMSYTKKPVNPKIFEYQYDYDDYYDLYRPMKMNRELVNEHHARQTMTTSSSTTTERPRTVWPTLPTLPTLPPLLTIRRPGTTGSDMSSMQTNSLPKLPRWFLQIFESLAIKTTPSPQLASTSEELYRETPIDDGYDDEQANFKIQNTLPATSMVYTEMPRYTRQRTSAMTRQHRRTTPFANNDHAFQGSSRPHLRQRTSTSVVPINYQGDRDGIGRQIGANSGQSVGGLGLANGQSGIVIGNNSGNGKRPARRPIATRPLPQQPPSYYYSL